MTSNFLFLGIGVGLLVLSTINSLNSISVTRNMSAIHFDSMGVESSGSSDYDILGGSLQEHAAGIVVSVSDATGKTNYYSEDNANIVREREGNSIQIHIDLINDNDKKREQIDEEEESETHQEQQQHCPSVIRNKVGLFDTKKSDSPLKDDFHDTILLVSSNYAYYNMLQNWEFLANELNLQWAVLALDDKLYEELGPSRAIPPGEAFSVSGAHEWRKGNFNGLSCNKIRMALQVANNCNVNVVFTDADNIFFKNPFEHDLGRLIKSKKYDYLYQPNHPAQNPREDQCLQGIPRDEANTGFYYFSYTSEIYKSIADSTLERCQDPDNKLDDQSLFWKEFWNAKRKIASNNRDESNNSSGVDFHHCRLNDYENPTSAIADEDTFNYCCMDPYYYPTGKHSPRSGPSNNDPITYHANFVPNYGQKVAKLVYARSDRHGWDMSRFKDGIGGILN